MSIFKKAEEMVKKVYSNKTIPILIKNMGLDCEVVRGSKTSEEYQFYGRSSGHSPLSLDERITFNARLLITGDEVFDVRGIDISSTTSSAIIYSLEEILLQVNDYVHVLPLNGNDIQERWWKIVEPQGVGHTVELLKNRYNALAVEGLPNG